MSYVPNGKVGRPKKERHITEMKSYKSNVLEKERHIHLLLVSCSSSALQSNIKHYVEKIPGNTQQDYKIKVKEIKFRTSRMNMFINSGIIDTIFSNKSQLFSMAVEKDKNYIDNYIKRLRNRYNINVEEEVIRFDAAKYKSNKEDNKRRMSKLDNENLFKIIRVPKSRKNDLRDKLAIERYIYISLNKK